MTFQPLDASNHTAECTFTGESNAVLVVDVLGAVKTNRKCDTSTRAQVENLFLDQNPIGLNADSTFGRECLTQRREQKSEALGSEQKWLTTMKNYSKRTILFMCKVPKRFCCNTTGFARHSLGHSRPPTVAHTIHITIVAIYVTAAGNLEQNGIEFDHWEGLIFRSARPVVAIVHAVVGVGPLGSFIAHLFYKPG